MAISDLDESAIKIPALDVKAVEQKLRARIRKAQ
jgi:hypothetical protein